MPLPKSDRVVDVRRDALKIGRYWRTVKLLRPRQVLWRLRLRSQRYLATRFGFVLEPLWTPRVAHTPPSWPAAFIPLDARRFSSPTTGAALIDGRIELLGRRADLGDDWQQMALPQLWRYHLHYWDWAWHIVNSFPKEQAAREVQRLLESWNDESHYGRGDAWSPYVVSLRLWTFCGLASRLSLNESPTESFVRHIRRELGYVRANLEFDVGGNHLVKNLKALIGAGVFLGDHTTVDWAVSRLFEQIPVQILPDGGHYERSPAYHAQVLADFIDVSRLLTAVGQRRSEIDSAVEQMKWWLVYMVGPDRRTPCLNDGPTVDSNELALLGVDRPATPERVAVLDQSGYVVVNLPGDIHLVVDVGDPCPPELPAHAHADCLSFELAIGPRRYVVDSGTSEYGSGLRRAYERSTQAHSTVEVDKQDQTEVWGAFRAGRRAHPTLLNVDDNDERVLIDAEHDGYRHLPGAPIHRRVIEISTRGLSVRDIIRGRGVHTVTSRLFIASDVKDVTHAYNGIECRDLRIQCCSGPLTIDHDSYALRFGDQLPAAVLSQHLTTALPVAVGWQVSFNNQRITREDSPKTCDN